MQKKKKKEKGHTDRFSDIHLPPDNSIWFYSLKAVVCVLKLPFIPTNFVQFLTTCYSHLCDTSHFFFSSLPSAPRSQDDIMNILITRNGDIPEITSISSLITITTLSKIPPILLYFSPSVVLDPTRP